MESITTQLYPEMSSEVQSVFVRVDALHPSQQFFSHVGTFTQCLQ